MHICLHLKLLNHSLRKVNCSIIFSHVLYYCITMRITSAMNSQKALLKEEILKKYRLVTESERKRNSELTILTADMMTCPFVNDAYKQNLLTLMGITEMRDQQNDNELC